MTEELRSFNAKATPTTQHRKKQHSNAAASNILIESENLNIIHYLSRHWIELPKSPEGTPIYRLTWLNEI